MKINSGHTVVNGTSNVTTRNTVPQPPQKPAPARRPLANTGRRGCAKCGKRN